VTDKVAFEEDLPKYLIFPVSITPPLPHTIFMYMLLLSEGQKAGASFGN
jgi:hypothetical protein